MRFTLFIEIRNLPYSRSSQIVSHDRGKFYWNRSNTFQYAFLRELTNYSRKKYAKRTKHKFHVFEEKRQRTDVTTFFFFLFCQFMKVGLTFLSKSDG